MAFSSKTSLINMDQHCNDPFYRYKFEPVLVKYEGKNTGKVTIITNIYNIASNVIGVQMDSDNAGANKNKYSSDIIHKTADHLTKFIRKKVSGKCKYHKSSKQTIISGRHEIDILQNYLFKYVEQYARCPKCRKEELTPAIQANIRCKSCGWKDKQRVGGKKKKQKKKKKKKNKKVDTSEEKDNEDDEEEDPIFAFNHYLEQQSEENIEDGIMEKIKILSIAHKLDRKEQIKLVMYCLLNYQKDDYKLLIKSIKTYSGILETFTLLKDDIPILLSYMEQIIMQKSVGTNLLNHSFQILHCLYDEDIVGEDELIEWHQTVDDNKYSLISKTEAQAIRQKNTSIY